MKLIILGWNPMGFFFTIFVLSDVPLMYSPNHYKMAMPSVNGGNAQGEGFILAPPLVIPITYHSFITWR
jgi:hypothetical protein